MTTTLLEAVHQGAGDTHHMAAWHWLEDQLSAEQLTEFLSIFDGGPEHSPFNSASTWAPTLPRQQRPA